MECIPRELVLNVLSRLPTGDLMRCKCVCKFWFYIITEPHFISNYYLFHSSQEVQHEYLLLTRTSNCFSMILVVSWNLNEPIGLISSVINPPLSQEGFWVDIMGPCNGVYFLKGKPNIIMNPSLNKFITLPEPQRTSRSCDYYPRFGFDPKTNDYKVVLINDLFLDFILTGDWRVEVYNLNSNSWKILKGISNPFPFNINDKSRFFTYVNDCCHWWGWDYKSDKDGSSHGEKVVLSFNMVSETFRRIKVPKINDSSSSPNLTVKSNENLIPFCESTTIGVVVDYYHVDKGTSECFCFDVWMMKDYWDERSWIKRYSFGPMPVVYNLFVGNCGSNQFFWKDIGEGTLALNGPDCEKLFIDFLIYGNLESITAVRYMKSLVSLLSKNQSST